MAITTEQIRANGRASAADTRAGFARRQRIRRGVGVVLVAAAVLVGWQRDTAARHREGVLVVTRPVPAGQPLTAADIGIGHVALDGRVARMPATAREDVIGKIAMIDLRPRWLLLEDWLAPADKADAEKVLLPLPLKTGRFPPGLQVGDHVVVVVTADDRMGGRESDADASLPAVVVGVDGERGAFGVGETVVTVSIPKADLARLAAAGGDGRVLLAASR